MILEIKYALFFEWMLDPQKVVRCPVITPGLERPFFLRKDFSLPNLILK